MTWYSVHIYIYIYIYIYNRVCIIVYYSLRDAFGLSLSSRGRAGLKVPGLRRLCSSLSLLFLFLLFSLALFIVTIVNTIVIDTITIIIIIVIGIIVIVTVIIIVSTIRIISIIYQHHQSSYLLLVPGLWRARTYIILYYIILYYIILHPL